MFKGFLWHFLVVLLALLQPSRAFGVTVFDFDQIQSTTKKKGVKAADVEIYMEGLYGSDLAVSPKANAVRGPNFYGSADLSGVPGSYLTVGKGKGAPAITIDFGDNPIDSFSVDFKLFRKAKRFSILADGELINLQTLTKAQRKTGLSGHQSAFFFDTPVQTLQFVGSKKKSFAIDNLVVDLPSDLDHGSGFGLISGSAFTGNTNGFPDTTGFSDTGTINQVADVPEPASLLLLFVGSFGLMFLPKARGSLMKH